MNYLSQIYRSSLEGASRHRVLPISYFVAMGSNRCTTTLCVRVMDAIEIGCRETETRLWDNEPAGSPRPVEAATNSVDRLFEDIRLQIDNIVEENLSKAVDDVS